MSGKYTREDILNIIQDEDVEFIYLQFTDIFGVMKNVAITPEMFERALNDQVMFDGSSIDGFIRVEESDMYLKPDLDSFIVYPWRNNISSEARLICDVFNTDGTPFGGDPRHVLKNICRQAESMGYTLYAGPECEFFLFHTDEKGKPTLITHDDAGYFDLAPVDLGENARKEIVKTLRKMGFEIEASHHEIAPGQHEIDLRSDEVLNTADKIMTLKTVVRMVAKNHGLHATFMPKPVYGIAGSGMHMNISILKEGKNIFYDDNDSLHLSKEGYSFIAGVLRHARGICAVTNPTVNSYKRLASGYEAPLFVTWSAKDRSPLIRVPAQRGLDTHFEVRNPDPSCNPYLALAAIFKAGLDGIENSLRIPDSVDENINDMPAEDRKALKINKLPGTLEEAIDCFQSDDITQKALGEHIYSRFLEAKKLEWKDYSNRINQWEIDQYLTKF